MSPRFARPVFGGELGELAFVASVAGAERLAAFGVRLFDGHVGIAEADDFFFAAFAGFDD